ncbi:MAG: carboxypeptidase-like regulatory domain-containing protein [Ginsengibacter sp.]
MKSTFFFIICFSFSCHSFAQNTLTGTIKTENNTPVPNATVLLHSLSPSRPLISFATSDSKGSYSLNIPDRKTKYSITVRAGSYKEVEKIIEFNVDTLAQKLDFVLRSSVAYLDTVRIDIKFKISVTGDTLTFNPDAYSRKNETTIEQLLRNIPGIDIKENGKITFNGASISGVLIDGMIFLKEIINNLLKMPHQKL